MTKSQATKLQALTTKLSRRSVDGSLCFHVQASGDSLIFAATNIYSELRWFERTADFYAIIGPRGGVRKYAGNLYL